MCNVHVYILLTVNIHVHVVLFMSYLHIVSTQAHIENSVHTCMYT